MILGDKIIALGRQLGWSQEQLAEEAGEYMEVVESVAEKMAAGVGLFIVSPVLLLVLAGIVDKKRKEYAPKFRLLLAVGIVMCIVSVIPLVVAGAFGASDVVCVCLVGVLLVCCAVGVFFIVSCCFIWRTGWYGKCFFKRNVKCI